MVRAEVERPEPVAGDISCFFLNDEAVLFSTSRQQLYRLNTTAAFIWCCCEEGLTSEVVAEEVASTFKIPISLARRDVLSTLAAWKALGVAAGQEPSDMHPVSEDEALAPIEFPCTISFLTKQADKRERRYRLLDSYFRICFANAVAERIVHPVLAHLEVQADTACHIALDIIEDKQGYILLQDAILIDECSASEQLAPLVHAHILFTAYRSADCLMAIHAAAISKGDKCILFPSASGNGKSTLTAALIHSGFEYLTDELAVLTRGTYQIRPLSVSLSIKQGSWSVLAPLYPHIHDLPIHLRKDGKRVRYLPPSRVIPSNHSRQSYPLQCVVFAKYQAKVKTTITPITPADALCRLTEAGYDVNDRLDAARIGELVSWIAGLDCYELQFSRLPEAISQIEGLWQ